MKRNGRDGVEEVRQREGYLYGERKDRVFKTIVVGSRTNNNPIQQVEIYDC